MRSSVNGKVWILCLVFIVLSNAAVFANGGPEDESGAKQAVTPEGVFPIVEEKMTITAFIAGSSFVDDFQDNDFTRYIEEKTNIHLELDVAATDAAQKRNLLLASGDYPEIFIANFSKSEQQFYGSQGVFLPLNDLIDQYGVNTRKAFADYPLVKKNIPTPDGKIYALPDINDCFHCQYAQKMWIYRPWLEKLGLEMPTTTEEFKEVLIAFRDRDPNGNGIKDEIPLSGSASAWFGGVDGFLMNSFVYSHGNLADGGLRTYVDKGKITAAFVQPAWREGLRYMKDLYSEGLLAGEPFTQDANQYLQLGENPDTVILGAGTAGHNGIFTQFHGESGRWLEYTVVPPLEGPDGTRFARYDPEYGSWTAWSITDKAANPEAAFRLGDAFYEMDMMLHSIHGREGIEWVLAEPGEIGINGRQAIWKALVEYGAGGRKSWWNTGGPQIMSSDFRLGQVRGEGVSLEGILYEETRDKMAPYQVDIDMIVPPLSFDEDTAADVVELESSLGTYITEMIARFIVGDANIETEWEAYLAELETIGLPRYIELVQEAYDKR